MIEHAELFIDGTRHRAGLAQLHNAARAAARSGADALADSLTQLRLSTSERADD